MRGSAPVSACTDSGISCSKVVPMSFITAASRFGFCPACSMVAIESDICRSVTRCAVKWPISAAARSPGSLAVLADQHVVGDEAVLEMHLVEVMAAGQIDDRADRDARRLQIHEELGEP